MRILLAAVLVLAVGPAVADYAICNPNLCARRSCGQGTGCGNPDGCAVLQDFWCADGSAIDEPACAGGGAGAGACPRCDDPAYQPYDSCNPAGSCPLGLGEAEKCTDLIDNNFDGCINENCPIGEPPCTCIGFCPAGSKSCAAGGTMATCDPYKPDVPETCGNGKDDNCNKRPDENCAPKPCRRGAPTGEGSCTETCADSAGNDPILLATQSAVTEPFTDFKVETLAALELTRTYSSADTSLFGGPVGAFGRGWHHGWEADLRCTSSRCTVTQGLYEALEFSWSGTAASLDGTETWNVYRPFSNGQSTSGSEGILVSRPNGDWILYMPNGRELTFRSACDACAGAEGSDPYCLPLGSGGRARLVKVVDEAGRSRHLAYDRRAGLLVEISDDLGHALRLVSADACGTGLATELRYDGRRVASYAYQGWDLVNVTDGAGARLRGYAYDPVNGGLLYAVLDEAGNAVVEFSYDSAGRAIGVVDASSSVSVSYSAGGLTYVTEQFAGGTATSQRTLNPQGQVVSVSDQCACGQARMFKYADQKLVCTTDAVGHVTYRGRDALGRVVHQAEYANQACPPTSYLSGAREEWRDYGVTKPIAQGVTLDLDHVASISRRSTINASQYAAESFDYDPAPKSIDPAGYACTAAPLPAGTALCRQIRTGYLTASNGSIVMDRLATFYSYDSRGRLTRTVGPVSLDRPSASDVTPVEERSYWADGESLDRRGRLREVKRFPQPGAAPLVTQLDYDAFGASRITGPDAAVVQITHDIRGRPIVVSGPGASRTETRYQDGLSPRLVLSATGSARRYSYDSKGRLSSIEYLPSDPDVPGSNPAVAWSEHYTYDEAGNVIHSERRDSAGTVVWKQDRAYDVQHRLVQETHPESPALSRSWSYGTSGFLASVLDEEGRGVAFTPDTLDRVTNVRRTGVDAQGAPVGLDVAQYAYQSYVDSLASVRDGKGQSTWYRYDDFGRLENVSSYTFKWGGVDLRYDPRGNVVERRLGFVTETYTYDGLDRLKTRRASNSMDGTSVAYTYVYDEAGEAGRLTSVVEPDRTIRYGYDAAGRLETETVTENGISTPLVTTYGYDADGDLTSVRYPSGLEVAYDLDPATKRPVRVRNAVTGAVYASNVTHLSSGPVRSLTFGNGLTLAQEFDLRYGPRSIASGGVSLAYTMSPAGDVKTIAEGGTTRTFTYDFLDRLTGSPGGSPSATTGRGTARPRR